MTRKLQSKPAAYPKKSKANLTTSRSARRIRLLCLISYLIVPIFFTLLYLAMTMNYEDMYQRAADLHENIGTVWYRIYHWLPRTGEIYQRTAVHFMTPQLSFGPDLIFRLCTAAIASGLIFLLTMFVLGRRPRFAVRDALVYLGIFTFLILLGLSEIFVFNFSYTHNYVICAFLLVAFILPYRLKLEKCKPITYISIFILGILLGMSSEIIPVALLIIFIALAVIQLKANHSVRNLWQKYKLYIIGALGLVCGATLYYIGANLDMRVNGGYSEIYDYISPFGIFENPVYTIGKLIRHLIYNIRHLHFAIILMLFILFLEYVNYRRKQSNHLAIQTCCFAFCVLYVGATSLLAVHEDLYYRFMSPVYVTVYASVWLCVSDYLFSPKVLTERSLRNALIILVALGVLMVCDSSYAMIRYNLTVKPYLQGITVDENYYPIFDKSLTAGEHDMTYSPIFQIRQSSPFHWL